MPDTIIVRRLSCSQRRRGVGVVGAVMVTSGILKSTLDSTALPQGLIEWRLGRALRNRPVGCKPNGAWFNGLGAATVAELNLVLSVVLSFCIFLGLAGHLLFPDGPVEARLAFTYHLFVAGLAALGMSFAALVIEAVRRCRDRYYEGRICLCALSGVFAIFALIGVLGCREYDYFRTWGFSFDLGRREFADLSYWEYSWCVGDARDLDLSPAGRIWFATKTTRDSGGYALWRVRLAPRSYAVFLRNNTVLKRHLQVYAAHQIPWKEIPHRWAEAPAFDWWRPPASLGGCECHQWSDQSGTAVAWSVYDPLNETLWFRQ